MLTGQLNPSARCAVLEHLLGVLFPILDSSTNHAGVNKVKEVIAIRPLALDVINFELHICVGPGRLDRGKVNAGNDRSGMGFAEIKSPDTGTGTCEYN